VGNNGIKILALQRCLVKPFCHRLSATDASSTNRDALAAAVEAAGAFE
jgi:hypothetical protein